MRFDEDQSLPRSELTVSEWVMGHGSVGHGSNGSNGSMNMDVSHESWVMWDPVTH